VNTVIGSSDTSGLCIAEESIASSIVARTSFVESAESAARG